jgi:hypothetical protein
VFYIFFLKNFIDGIIPIKTPPKPLYKGGYGRGEGVPTPYRGYMGGSTHLYGILPPVIYIYYIPIALPTTTSARIQITNRVKALKGLFILWGFNCGTNIRQQLSPTK